MTRSAIMVKSNYMRAITGVSSPAGGSRGIRQAGLVAAESPDELRRRNEMLEQRISNLGAALLRVSASLDLETVLREIVDSARAHFRNLPEPLRVADLPAYVRELGLPTGLIRSKTMQCTPMRHRDVHVETFFLGEKDGGRAFTRADEELLVLFGSQAATAIANARTYRDERRARADLEAQIETLPVGVAVFDGGSVGVRSFNREARRIVERLRLPGRELEELLELLHQLLVESLARSQSYATPYTTVGSQMSNASLPACALPCRQLPGSGSPPIPVRRTA